MELYEVIIDQIALPTHNDTRTNHFDIYPIYNLLAACVLVHSAWVPRSQMRLFSHVILKGVGIRSFAYAIRRKPFLSIFVQSLYITADWSATPISHIFAAQRFPNLRYIGVECLDLQREPVALFKFAASFTSVKHLELTKPTKCLPSQLKRFIGSFRSLSTLSLDINDLPKPIIYALPQRAFHAPSLHNLDITLEPGIDAILRWFTTSGPSPLRLQRLTLRWSIPGGSLSRARLSFHGLRDLFRSCNASLQELCCKATLHYPLIPYNFPSLGKSIHSP